MKKRVVPEKGIDIPQQARDELFSKVNRLCQSIDSIEGHTDLLPDVEIFANAVLYALEQEVFYENSDLEYAARLLEIGMGRLGELESGLAPWTVETGLVVRGYRSNLDDSVQPYGLVVPDKYDPSNERQHRLDIWHHGRNAKGTELRFLVERTTDPGRFTPDDTFVLHTYGRYCNAMKFGGEVDTFEAIEHAKSQYGIDDNKICVRGFSMGGAATWHLSTHYAGEWAAATPGAGFAETAVYQDVAEREEQPPWWEQKLWALYDATKVAGNLHQCPTIAYSGENDKQMQASDIMAEHMAAEGLDLPHIIGPGMGHEYDDDSKAEIERLLVPFVEKGRNLTPDRIRFTLYTLKYNRMLWIQVDALEKHWERSRVNADLVSGGVAINTEGVAALTIDFSEEDCPFERDTNPEIKIDGQKLIGPRVVAGQDWVLYLVKNGDWSTGRLTGIRKRQGLHGPIDDAFMSRFMMVTPTGTPSVSSDASEWIRQEQENAIYQWKMQFRGDPLVKRDNGIEDSDIESCHLVLWGDPSSNKIYERIAEQLPIEWSDEGIVAGDFRASESTRVPVFVYPNPLNPERYVVLNSGFTFAPSGSMSNATQTPKLPDWAVLDTEVEWDRRPQEGVVACGFFDERWAIR